MTSTTSATDGGLTPKQAAEIKREISSRALLAGEAGYDAETSVFNLNNPLAPAVVVAASGPSDIRAALRFAQRHGRAVAVRGTGHQVARVVNGAVLINTSRMNGVDIDPVKRIARVEAGVRWSEVVEVCAKHGLAPMSGSAATVGVVGYLLGGGQSPVFGRLLGYAADHVHKIEIVTADGESRTVTAQSDPELFWALRGGKGNFGVVTAVEFSVFPMPWFYGGGVYFPGERAADVLHAWREWAPTLPEEASTSVAVQRLPPLPDLPAPIRGAFVVHLRFSYLGDTAEGGRLFAPIRAITSPLIDAVSDRPYTESALIHMDPPHPLPYYDRSTALSELSRENTDALLELIGPGTDCPLVSVEIRALGGALDREPTAPNAVTTRGIPFVLFAFGAGGQDQADLMRGHLDRLVRGLEPWAGDGRQMVNFLSADEATTPDQVREVYGAQRYDRLAAVKRAVDPTNTFRMNHNILPASRDRVGTTSAAASPTISRKTSPNSTPGEDVGSRT